MRLTQRDVLGIPFCRNAGYIEMLDKLAAYEYIGLSPEEIKLNLDGLDEYHKAEAEGRLVLLPCKVGDTLYAPTRNIVSEFRVEVFEYGGYNERFLWIGWHLTKGFTGNFRLDGIRASEIGKTVFLTREEAEAALKGESRDV